MTASALMSAEALKVRGTAAMWLAAAAPLLAIVLHIIALLDRYSYPGGDTAAVWRTLLRDGWGIWLFFAALLPTVEAAFLAHLEHRGNQWKQLFAYPIPRRRFFAAKMVWCGLLVGAGFAIATAGFLANVLVYGAVHGFHLGPSIPWSGIASTAGRGFAACWLAIAIQTWLSARFAGMGPPVGIGFAALLIGLAIGHAFPSLWPWTMTLRTFRASRYDVHNTAVPVILGCLGGMAAGALACWDLGRRRELI